MIESFKSKALKKLWYDNDSSKINTAHLTRVELVLTIINGLDEVPKDLGIYSNLRPHELKGKEKGIWSLDISGNYRITFRFEKGNAYDLDYLDTH
ncbi:type II toxin-antitoxin system RelE/ParE family toxin [uncultured Flavobacterium sp.]|uniref:type II toxin-antitoxin system RelE/ParE family toxin n=1 Tax=uncultured Flavobacterium sp. TaxID=165435 RepID=UPI002596DDD8|nr:type II toxin-antitoxin system RelE/ParE family toxin [uncultured Flavobacterium sp.]